MTPERRWGAASRAESRRPPEKPYEEEIPRAELVVGGLCVVVGAAGGLLGHVLTAHELRLAWLLGLVPVFLLAYRVGWKGAAVAALAVVAALVSVEVASTRFLDGAVDWSFVAGAGLVLLAVSLGAGALSKMLRQRNAEALQMAYEDPLTELANRRLLERDAERAIEQAGRSGGHVVILFIDLVRFKRINDELGHEAGDRALTVVARRLLKRLRTSDTVARVGGDEFAVLLPDVDDLSVVEVVKDRIEKGLWDPVQLAGQTLHLGIRFGWSAFPRDGAEVDELLWAADPKKGEDRHRGARGPAGGPGFDIALEDDLEEAIRSGDSLFLHYQPVGSMSGERVVGMEALLRWNHPERGLLAAAAFVQVAERIGLIAEMERRGLREAVGRAERWTRDGESLWTSVNLSLQSLQDGETYDYVAELLEEAELAPSRLVVEVTENIVARKPQSVVEGLSRLRSRGVRVAVDDFGTGHCSVEHLERFPADMLKVDRGLVDRLGESGRHERLAESIIGLAKGLRLEVVAEGVETESQREWLRDAGCELYQGYLLGRPGPAEQARELREEGERAEARG